MAVPGVDVLAFEISGHRYGLVGGDVQELLRAVQVTPLPRAPRIVEGIVNVRGRIVPVFDLRARFRLPARSLDPTEHLLLAWAGSRLVAIRVDRAVELLRVDAATIEDIGSLVVGTDYVAGVVKLPDGLLLIHDPAAFLSQAEGEQLDSALREAQPAGEEA